LIHFTILPIHYYLHSIIIIIAISFILLSSLGGPLCEFGDRRLGNAVVCPSKAHIWNLTETNVAFASPSLDRRHTIHSFSSINKQHILFTMAPVSFRVS
jgi:hypothetical protein